MNEEVELILEETTDRMQKALEHLEYELAHLRAGRATPVLLDGITCFLTMETWYRSFH